MKSTIIFIPDISGFSEFVSEIDIVHGQEIAAELLEDIINSDLLGLEISEIEGDAVLFYSTDVGINLERFYMQAQLTFKNFKAKKEKIQNKRICRCNACTSVQNLSLKFVLHSDDMEIMEIRNFKKLYGKGVIIAHRLLKNNLIENEYIILTKKYLDTDVIKNRQVINLVPINQTLEGIGEMECFYIKLTNPN